MRVLSIALLLLAVSAGYASAQVCAFVPNYSTGPNSGDGVVSVIPTDINRIVRDINVESIPGGTAFSPDGSILYVTNGDSASVSVIRTSDGSVLGTIGVGDSPDGEVVTPDGRFLYVANFQGNSVSVIRTSDNTVVDTIDFSPAQVRGLSVSPDGEFVYLTAEGVYVIRTSDNAVVDFIALPGSDVFSGALTPDGEFLYVTERGSDNVAVIRIANDTFLFTIPVPGQPQGIVSSPDGQFMYVTQGDLGSVAVIRTSDNTVVDTILTSPDSRPGNVDVTADGRTLYVVNGIPGGVSVVDLLTGTIVTQIRFREDFTSSIGRFIGPCGDLANVDIPTLSEWGMIAAAAGLAMIGVLFAIKRKRAQAA